MGKEREEEEEEIGPKRRRKFSVDAQEIGDSGGLGVEEGGVEEADAQKPEAAYLRRRKKLKRISKEWPMGTKLALAELGERQRRAG